jgi:hypothetical protein
MSPIETNPKHYELFSLARKNEHTLYIHIINIITIVMLQM